MKLLKLAGMEDLEEMIDKVHSLEIINPKRQNDPEIIDHLVSIVRMQNNMIHKLLFQIGAEHQWSGYDEVRLEHQIDLVRG